MQKIHKIVLYCDHWQNGGVEAYLMNQLRHWDLSKMECSILTAEKTTDIYDRELQQMKVQHYVLLEGECSSPILRILKTFQDFNHFLQKHPCDILYLNLTNSVTMRYARIAEHVGIPRRIVHSHCSGVQPGRTRAIKLAAHKVAKTWYTNAATDWWACSDLAANFLFAEKKLEQVVYIPNAIETERFKFYEKQRREMRHRIFCIEENIKIIGTVGRCSAEKNQSFLLDVFAAVHCLLPKTKLLLVGDGPLRPTLETKAEELGISDACIFYGFTDDIAPLYSAMDAFCLPSVVEGFGIVALEAQAAGCKCLLSNFVSKQVGILQDVYHLPLKTQIWTEKVLEILQEQSSDQLRKEAFMKIRDMGFDIADNARKTQNLLLGLSDNGVSLS